MELTNKIGEGRYRECFATDNPDLCAKKMKERIEKDYLGWKVHYNAKIYTLLKFGISNLNEKELDIINNLPEKLSSYIPNNVSIEGDYLLMERPKDYSGEYSKTVQQYGKVENDIFWDHVKNIYDIFAENDLWFLDVFHHGNNLLVQKISESEYKPVIIDFKRLGHSMYPFQFNLRLLSEQRKKFHRRFEKFKEQYK